MTGRSSSRFVRGAVVAGALAMLGASCSSSNTKSSSSTAATTATTAAATTTAAAATPTTGATETSGATATSGATETSGATATTGGASAGSAGCPKIDTSLDKDGGTGAGRFVSDLTCAGTKPLKATGDPIVIGFQNPEGDPNGSFPEFSIAAQAAVNYINNELGGLGADIQNGKAGRPIKLEVCKMAISPDDSQRCANELLTKKPFAVFSSINFFGNQFPIYAAAKEPVIVITPITVGDFTSPGVYSIGGGGGCLGVHTGLVKFVTSQLKAKKVGIPWADTPPGVVCYYDLEAKPMDVLSGKVKGSSSAAGSIPDLTYLGVSVKPATPDVSPQVTQILDFKPDAIMFSAQGADCWNFVDGLGRLGWKPDAIPLVLSGACIDFAAMKAAGDLAKGIYFIGSSGTVLNDPATIKDTLGKVEAQAYQTKGAANGLDKDNLNKGFATQGFTGMLSLWEMTSEIVVKGGQLTQDALAKAYSETKGQHLFGSTPLSCSTAPAPYVAVCNSEVSATQWDGTKLVPVGSHFNAIDLVAGTEIKPGP